MCNRVFRCVLGPVFLALYFAAPGVAEEAELPFEDENVFAVVAALPAPPKAEAATRALNLALAGVAQQVDQVTTLADRYRREGAFEKAEESLAHFPPEKAQELDEYSRQALAGANFNLGMTYLKRSRYAEAAVAFRRAGKLDTVDAKTAYCLGTACRKQERYEEAVDALKRAVRLNPDMAPAYFSLGSAYLGQDKVEDAREAYLRAVEKDPGHLAAHFMLGSLAWNRGDWQDAARAWQEVLNINPDHEKARTWLAKARAKSGEPAPESESRG